MIKRRNLIVFTSSILLFFIGCSSTSEHKRMKTLASSECRVVNDVLSYVGLTMEEFAGKEYLNQKKISRFTMSFDVQTGNYIKGFQQIAIKMCLRDREYIVGKNHDHPYLNYRYSSNSPDLYMILDEAKKKSITLRVKDVKPLLERFQNLLKQDKAKLVSSIRRISIDRNFSTSTDISYPKTNGMSKISAKRLRKKFLQESIADIYSELFRLPKNNTQISSFLDRYFPGQFNREQFMKIKGNIFKKIENYDLSYRHPKLVHMYSILDSDHWYYSIGSNRGGILDKEANQKDLVENKQTRQDLMGFILLSDSKVIVRRLSKDVVQVEVVINFPEIKKKYPYGEIKKYIE